MFGAEPAGLEPHVLADPNVTALVRIPMLPARRSLNLANCAALVTYEAWRQQGFAGA
jgi:tRNA (cytidine/uridine-2'-O-)-methyltransferase